MFIDVSKHDLDEIRVPGGVCIIGSGMGASSLAMELRHAGLPFAIVEAGGMKRTLGVVAEENIGIPFRLGVATRSIEVGGTSNLWGGGLVPFCESDFEKKAWIPHSGWPIQYRALEPYYRRAGDVFGLANYDFFNPEVALSNLRHNLLNMPLNESVLESRITLILKPATAFKNKLKRVTRRSDKFHCYYNLCALELSANNADGVGHVIAGKSDGSRIKIYADKFVVCTGALETPRLLLNSRIENRNVGKFLMDHPMGDLGSVLFRDRQEFYACGHHKLSRGVYIKFRLSLNEKIREAEQLPNHCFNIFPHWIDSFCDMEEEVLECLRRLRTLKKKNVSFKDIRNVAGNFGVALRILACRITPKIYPRSGTLFFVTEQIPNSSSTVTLSDNKDQFGYRIAKVNWQLTEEDFSSLDRYLAILQERAFPKQHCQSVRILEDLKKRESFTSAAHHLGTVRMADSPSDGVVDRNLKVFGMHNLYVCDSSVFPTSGNANCSFTISALACRLADHLRGMG